MVTDVVVHQTNMAGLLLVEAAEGDDADKVVSLLDPGAPVGLKDKHGWTAAIAAMRYGRDT